jgi:ADP-heptose:LPS heptosyltransferase
MEKVLLIQTAFLGDVILMTPVISELKRIYPSVKIDVLVKKGNESLLSGNPKLNNVFVFDKANGKWKQIRLLSKQFKNNQYDYIFNFHRFASSGLIAVLSKGKKLYGFKKNPLALFYSKKFEHEIGNGLHEVSRNLSLIEEFGAQKLIRPELFPSEKQFNSVEIFKRQPYVCIAPSSVWFTKMLPKEKWIELLQTKLKEEKVYILGAKSDGKLADELIQKSGHASIQNVCGTLDLLSSAALMKDAKRNYVNDSGPLHLASAMNAPTTAYFCSTVPSFGFGPLAEDAEIKEVLNLDCRPCGLHGHKACPKEHFKCGYQIEL